MERNCVFMFGRPLLPALFAGQLLLAGTALAGSCKDANVATGDALSEVVDKCGEPMLRERRTVKVEETDEKGARTATTTIIDELTFDAGPTEVMQMLRFENGKLAELRNVGYGRLNDAANDTCRNGESLAVGDTTVEAYIKCGEPLAREKKDDKVTETESGEKKVKTTVNVVEWTYRYGRDLPGYTLTIENGTVTGIRTRKFGE
ncbi:MAG TPA: DUF2845 domain-containing protein [Geobacteraceae bacterium]